MEAAWFTPEQGRELWQDYLRRKQLPAQQTQSFPQRRILDEPSPHRAFVYNTESEIIPAYACMRVVGTRNINNVTAINVEKPSSLDGEFLFNGQYPIAAASETETGVGWAYRFGVVIMLGDQPTEPGVQYQPIIGSWEIEEGSGPFVVYGYHRANENTDDRALIGRFAGGGSGGVLTVRFRIVAATEYCAECYATARIISGPPNVANPDTLPGTTFDYDAQYYTIKVYDMGEGWLNYPPEELLNMIGHATWLRSYEDGPCAEIPSLHWEIIDMQDPEEEVCE